MICSKILKILHTTLFPNVHHLAHLYLHSQEATFLWNNLFRIFGEHWVCPLTLMEFLIIRYWQEKGCYDYMAVAVHAVL